tara:strand:+ start:7035 stop:7256 length:222 start_codon:yes stop_codon:yes gene_type:complete
MSLDDHEKKYIKKVASFMSDRDIAVELTRIRGDFNNHNIVRTAHVRRVRRLLGLSKKRGTGFLDKDKNNDNKK